MYVCFLPKVNDHPERGALMQVRTVSPTGLVPVMQSRALADAYISDSLAICEFLAETNPRLPLWPRDPQLRAMARSAAAQMHSGFSVLRNNYGTNFVARYTGNVPVSDKAKEEVNYALSIWNNARNATKARLGELNEADEGFLFGGFSIADAFFWPVLWVSTLPSITLGRRVRRRNQC